MIAAPRQDFKAAILGRVRNRLYPLVSTHVTKATLVDGELKGSGLPCRVLFVHNCLFNTELRGRTFAGSPRVVQERTIFLPTLARHLRSNHGTYDICIAVLPETYARSLRNLSNFEGQEEVRQIIDITIGWEGMRQRFSNKRRQVTNSFQEKSGLTYRIARDAADFDYFYHRMYVPLIRRRYGDLAAIDSYDIMKSWFDRGFVLYVMKGSEAVAGALSELQSDTLLFRRSGVLDGDERHIKAGAQTALYYFQLRYAVDSGLRAVDTLKSSPILNDGVFRHKADWGAVASADDEAERRVLYFLNGRSDAQAAFFEINPMVIHTEKGLAGLVGRRASIGRPSKGHRDDPGALLAYGVGDIVEIAMPDASSVS